MSSKGAEYSLSHIQTEKKRDGYEFFPWFVLISFKRIAQSKPVQYLKDAYCNESPFFTLLAFTWFTFCIVLYAYLPETFLLWLNLLFQYVLCGIIPSLLYFVIYLWLGLFLKFKEIFFSIKGCLLSCIILEVSTEALSNMFTLNLNTESPIAIILFTIILMLTLTAFGTYFENMNNLGTLFLVNSVIAVRLLLVPTFSSKRWWIISSVQPLLVYFNIVTGLVLSTWPSLKIFKKSESCKTSMRYMLQDMASIPVIRQRRASSIEIPTLNQNGVGQTQNRRKSLPALGAPSIRKVSMSSMDLTILGEAHGMITDLLADSSLPLNVTGTLRIVADMISPLLQHNLHRQSLGTPLLTVLEKTMNNEDQEQVMNQPDLKDDTPLSLKQRLQRNLGVSSRRMSSSYTTTTSATGMPTIDMEYHTKKAKANATSAKIASKNKGNRSKSYAGAMTPAERNTLLKSHSRSFSQSYSPTSGSPLTSKKDQTNSDETIFKVEIERGKPVFFEGMDASESDNDNNESTDDEKHSEMISSKEVVIITQSNINHSNTNRTKFTLDERLEDVKETPEDNVSTNTKSETVESNTVESAELSEDEIENDNKTPIVNSPVAEQPKRGLRKLSDTSRTLRNCSLEKLSGSDENMDSGSSENLSIPPAHVMRRKSSRELHMEYEIAVSRDIDEMLSKVIDWDFPIFELSEKCNVLTQLAFRVFQLCGFFNSFKIPEVTFLKFFRALESGYHNIPYHNRIHAADVLHGVYYLTQHRIPGFSASCSRRASLTEESPSDNSPPMVIDDVEEKYTYGCISDAMPDLELMALYIAAAMHDFDHPGRTNAFLVATLNSKALLYNDRSVLENHHAAAAWSLLVTNPGLNFLSGLDSAEFKRLRFIVIEEILSTDLKKHFDFLSEWNAKISDQRGGLNFNSEADRLLVGQMAIKIADISGPSKEWDLHYRWTERIIEEFYQQGEDERSLGIPTSAYMDRDNPKVPQLQASFINHLVQPLYIAYEKAAIMPGEWLDVDSDDEEDNEADNEDVEENKSVDSDDDDDDNNNASDSEEKSESDSSKESTKKKVVYSVVSANIKKNYQQWLKIIAEEKEEENTEESKIAEQIDKSNENNNT